MAKPKAKAPSAPGLTLGEMATRSGVLTRVSEATTAIIDRSVADADHQGRVSLRVVSCHGCTAPKACCHVAVLIYLHEALPVAARLIADGRDTPALRAALRASAEAMENTPRAVHARAGRPCVFLDAGERCTIYRDRPAPCGVALVYSPALTCSAPDTSAVDPYRGTLHRELGPGIQDSVRATLRLPPLAHAYVGVLPRMVLLALQAWTRADYATFLAHHVAAAVARLQVGDVDASRR